MTVRLGMIITCGWFSGGCEWRTRQGLHSGRITQSAVDCSQGEGTRYDMVQGNYVWKAEKKLLISILQWLPWSLFPTGSVYFSGFFKRRKLPLLLQTYFDMPEGNDPVILRMTSMAKGMAWVNGKNIGRYWLSYLSPLEKPSQSE